MEFKPLPMPQKQNVEKSYIAILKMKKKILYLGSKADQSTNLTTSTIPHNLVQICQ